MNPETASAVPDGAQYPASAARDSASIEAVVDRAVSDATALFHDTDSERASEIVSDLRRALCDAIEGRPVLLAELPAHLTGSVFETLRQRFIVDSRDHGALTASETVRVLSEIGRLQALHDRRILRTHPRTFEEALAPVVDVAHDLRSPLAAVLFLLEIMRSGRSGPVSSVQQQQLRLIHSTILALNQVACDLIDYVRGTERFGDDGVQVFSVSAMLHTVADIVQPMAEEKGLTVELLPAERDMRVGRPTLLHRVMLNLTSNAIRYADRGMVLLSARETSSRGVEFAVRDQGRTIPTELLPRLFDPLRTGRDAQFSTFSSSGLGLAVCHRLVSELGGVLRVDTSPECGTRFYFDLYLPTAEPG